MSKLRLYAKVVRLFLSGKIVTGQDIGRSYNQVSNQYTDRFLSTMHCYNDEMLAELAKHLKSSEPLKILDLAAGTGYNSLVLREYYPSAELTLVDISPGMLKEARKKLQENASFVQGDMLAYLKNCPAETFDLVVCGWALKYRPPLEIIRQCRRVLKPGGCLAVIVNKKDTLPQVARIYPQLLQEHTEKIAKLMLTLPNPKTIRAFDNWFRKNFLRKILSKEGFHDFNFSTSRELAEFVVSTGALAGFDIMLDLRNPQVQEDMVRLLQKHKYTGATHSFVYGIYQKQR